MDEMYFHGTTTEQRAWTSSQEMRLKTPTSKGHRVTAANTGGEKGFIPNDMLVFKSGTKFWGNHNDMNYSKYEKRFNVSQYRVMSILHTFSFCIYLTLMAHNQLQSSSYNVTPPYHHEPGHVL
jgi:hypothetical protein